MVAFDGGRLDDVFWHLYWQFAAMAQELLAVALAVVNVALAYPFKASIALACRLTAVS